MANKVLKMNKHDKQLLQDITTMMTDPQQATNEKKIEELIHKIRVLDPVKAHDQLRLASCHFMTMYHTRKAMSIGSGNDPNNPMAQSLGNSNVGINLDDVNKFKEEQRADMELGWKFLKMQGDDEQINKTARVLKIEVAQRLEDSNKLNSAFKDLMKNKLSQEETMVAFTAAPFLGDWKALMNLGKIIERTKMGLEQLHMMSLQLPIPDFSVVYELAKQHELAKGPQPSIESLTWDLFNVKKIRVKFEDVDCGEFESKRKELLAEIKKQGEVDWEEVPNVTHVHVKRMGALCQAVSFGEIPMMLNGPWFDDKIHVKGRAEMPLMPEGDQGMASPFGMPSPDQMTILIQEEEWNLKRSKDNPNVYSGSYTLNQRPELPPKKKRTPEHAPVNMKFSLEVEIVKKDPSEDEKSDDVKENKIENADEDAIQDDEIQEVQSKHHVPESEKLVTEFDGLELD